MARRVPAGLQPLLDELYDGYNVADSAADPVQFVWRYDDADDREVVALIAASLAFGRLASVLATIERVLGVLGPSPAAWVRDMDLADARARLRPIVHRWTRGDNIAALLLVTRELRRRHGSLERCFVAHDDPAAPDVAPGLEGFVREACAVDVSAAYAPGRVRRPGVAYFFPRPGAGSACKRLNLFLRWMVRRDAIDPGGWTQVSPSRLVIPLDTHTIRVGRCLRLTSYVSPGWKMAADITATLRRFDPADPVRYDFSLCHMSMMGACGWGRAAGSAQCPLAAFCRPLRPARGRAVTR